MFKNKLDRKKKDKVKKKEEQGRTMQELYKEQANIIFNMINDVETDDFKKKIDQENIYKIKNEYTWK